MSTRPPESLAPGTIVHGCRLDRVLGAGSFGITYFADSKEHGRVAVKEFFPQGLALRDSAGKVRRDRQSMQAEGLEDADYDFLRTQFSREAERICGFDHPGVVRGLAHYPSGDGAYLVMRYATGHSLRHHLRHGGQGGFVSSPASIALLLTRLLEALRYIHDRQCVHCDLKPGNIFLGQDFAPVIIDFGTARHAFHERCFTEDERLQAFTPYYAPIELSPNGTGDIGPWTDIYEIGAVIYRCMTGGKIPAADDRVAGGRDDPWMPLVEYMAAEKAWPRQFLQLMDWSLQLRPANRPQSVKEWMAKLKPVLDQMIATQARGTTGPVQPPSHAKIIHSERIADDELRSTWTVLTTKRVPAIQPDILPKEEYEETTQGIAPGLKILLYGLIAALIITITLVILRE